PAGEVYRWHESPGALERLTPPWTKLQIVEEGKIENGSHTKLRQKAGLFSFNWDVEHREVREGKSFRDVQLQGPFGSWQHLHRLTQTGAGSSSLLDDIEYKLPGGALGQLIAGRAVRCELERTFRFRHARMSADLNATSRYGAVRPMRILLSGASGLIGRALIPFLRTQGHEIVRLVRGPARAQDEVHWDPIAGKLDEHALKNIDAVVHLAGLNVAQRWTTAKRKEIWESRVNGTRTLVEAVARLRHRPFVFVSAAATGYYGSCGANELTETSPKGSGFLADLCEAWEREVSAIDELEIRFAALRTGIVLSPQGGMLGKLLPTFRAGLGAQMDGGEQFLSWISIDDMVGAYYHAILDQRCSGPINAVSPQPVTNREFTQTLARVLHRPAFLRVPASALRLGFGEMANETVLSSARVVPEKLQAAGYEFRHPDLEAALKFLLGK
ncbi:MAG TPA: TIGR01777 family oxidoreductase, partial [Opitutaceae bacterium]